MFSYCVFLCTAFVTFICYLMLFIFYILNNLALYNKVFIALHKSVKQTNWQRKKKLYPLTTGHPVSSSEVLHSVFSRSDRWVSNNLTVVLYSMNYTNINFIHLHKLKCVSLNQTEIQMATILVLKPHLNCHDL